MMIRTPQIGRIALGSFLVLVVQCIDRRVCPPHSNKGILLFWVWEQIQLKGLCSSGFRERQIILMQPTCRKPFLCTVILSQISCILILSLKTLGLGPASDSAAELCCKFSLHGRGIGSGHLSDFMKHRRHAMQVFPGRCFINAS